MEGAFFFCHFVQPENGIFGIFILLVKSECRFFMPALRRLDTAAGACAKALPPFCAYMVAAHTAVRAGSISNELLCRMGARLPIVYQCE